MQWQSNDDFWGIDHTNGTGIALTVHAGGTTIISIAAAGDINDTNWYHIALIKKGTDIGLYKDGVQIGYHDNSGDADTQTVTGALYLATNGTNYNNLYTGHMDEFRFQNSNYFSVTPNVGLTSSFTAPTAEYSTRIPSGTGVGAPHIF